VIEPADIERMTKVERLQTMEWLWDSLVAEGVEPESPAWHGQVLAERMAKIESGEGAFLTMEELKARLARKA
jgi:putative addiction module component (TIGR02574 family)